MMPLLMFWLLADDCSSHLTPFTADGSVTKTTDDADQSGPSMISPNWPVDNATALSMKLELVNRSLLKKFLEIDVQQQPKKVNYAAKISYWQRVNLGVLLQRYVENGHTYHPQIVSMAKNFIEQQYIYWPPYASRYYFDRVLTQLSEVVYICRSLLRYTSVKALENRDERLVGLELLSKKTGWGNLFLQLIGRGGLLVNIFRKIGHIAYISDSKLKATTIENASLHLLSDFSDLVDLNNSVIKTNSVDFFGRNYHKYASEIMILYRFYALLHSYEVYLMYLQDFMNKERGILSFPTEFILDDNSFILDNPFIRKTVKELSDIVNDTTLIDFSAPATSSSSAP
jgi:hypothetical protein